MKRIGGGPSDNEAAASLSRIGVNNFTSPQNHSIEMSRKIPQHAVNQESIYNRTHGTEMAVQTDMDMATMQQMDTHAQPRNSGPHKL